MTTFEIMQIISGFTGSFGFAFLFNIRGKRLAVSAGGSLLTGLLFVLLGRVIAGEPTRYFLVALIVAAYAEIMARVLKTPTTTFITTALIPLIPGASLYYTMVSAFNGIGDGFVMKAVYTLQLASALALGIIVATSGTQLINRVGAYIRAHKN